MGGVGSIRMFASDVGVDPPIGGQYNVQDVLAATAVVPVVFASSVGGAFSDVPVAVPFDGTTATVACITAAPPAWLDNTGAILAAGLYLVTWSVTVLGPVATPGQWLGCQPYSFFQPPLPVDPLAAGLGAGVCEVVSVDTADVPVGINGAAFAPTDVTASALITVGIKQLAYYGP